MIIAPNRQDVITEDGRQSPRFADVIESLVTEVNAIKVESAANAATIAAIKSAVDAYTITNVTTDRQMDASSTVTTELADVVGTLIADLQDAT